MMHQCKMSPRLGSNYFFVHFFVLVSKCCIHFSSPLFVYNTDFGIQCSFNQFRTPSSVNLQVVLTFLNIHYGEQYKVSTHLAQIVRRIEVCHATQVFLLQDFPSSWKSYQQKRKKKEKGKLFSVYILFIQRNLCLFNLCLLLYGLVCS